MGSILSGDSDEQLLNILETRSSDITINNNSIMINELQFKFYPDIKDKCLKILNDAKLDNYKIKIFYYEKIIYGLHIDYNYIIRVYMSKALSQYPIVVDNKYYLNRKTI